MRFGVREICDVTFRSLKTNGIDIAGHHFKENQPCLYLDTAKTSTLEGAATTVYAQGGKGNPRLIAWEGEKTLTFTIEDALLSDVSLQMLTGAQFEKSSSSSKIYVHEVFEKIGKVEGTSSDKTVVFEFEENGAQGIVASGENKDKMPIFGAVLDSAGAARSYLSGDWAYTEGTSTTKAKFTYTPGTGETAENIVKTATRIDCYSEQTTGYKTFQITPYDFAGYYYIEASTLFRDEETGDDLPAEFIIPRGKIQSNFTFTMASSGDPSTFTFTVDAFPAYTKSDIANGGSAKKVLAAIQIKEDDPLASA